MSETTFSFNEDDLVRCDERQRSRGAGGPSSRSRCCADKLPNRWNRSDWNFTINTGPAFQKCGSEDVI
jgi:hypothetical protein